MVLPDVEGGILKESAIMVALSFSLSFSQFLFCSFPPVVWCINIDGDYVFSVNDSIITM